MATNIVVGVSGSGKTYYMVTHLVKTYFNEVDNEFTLKPQFKDLKIVTNIAELDLPHESLLDWIDKAGGPEKFFGLEFQEKVAKKYPRILYIIDECHRFFPPNLKCEPIYQWFSEHRHNGQDIYLMTQVFENIPRRIKNNAELAIQAIPQTLSLTGGNELNYNQFVNDTKVNQFPITLLKKRKIFALYKSQRSQGAGRLKNPFTKLVLVILIAGVVILGWTYNHWHQKKIKREEYKAAEVHSNGSVSSRYVKPSRLKVDVSYVSYKNHQLLAIGAMTWPMNQFPHKLEVDAFNNLYTYLSETDLATYTPTYPDSDSPSSRKSEGKERRK